MAKVEVEFEETEIEEDGRTGPGVIATCQECGDTVQSFGQTERSRIRCIMLLRENCEIGEANYYVDSEAL